MIDQLKQPNSDRIWTIGHGARDFDALAQALSSHGVQTIVDVRSQPYSKHAPEFAKRTLEEEAASAGFGYRWMGRTLGGRPLQPLDVLAAGLEELAGLCATSTVVLLCAEADPTRCHRSTALAPQLAGAGYEVIHILGDGAAAPHQPPLLPSA